MEQDGHLMDDIPIPESVGNLLKWREDVTPAGVLGKNGLFRFTDYQWFYGERDSWGHVFGVN